MQGFEAYAGGLAARGHTTTTSPRDGGEHWRSNVMLQARCSCLPLRYTALGHETIQLPS